MTNKDSSKLLKKQNEQLQKEIQDLKTKLETITSKVTDQQPNTCMSIQDGGSPPTTALSPSRTSSVEFMSDKYDELIEFKQGVLKELQGIRNTLDSIQEKWQKLNEAIQAMEEYSYQYNLKIIGLPLKAVHESSQTTTENCLSLFHAMGVHDISLQDIDIAHRVPSRRESNHPDAVICKFTRRLVKEKIMAARKNIKDLSAEDLGFHESICIQGLAVFDHLTPRLQNLLFEAKKYKRSHDYQFCWAKNGAVFLRESPGSKIYKISTMEDLAKLK